MDIYKVNDIAELISGNSYVGRGIVIGKSADGKKAVSAYFIMGRSANSRNRVFTVKNGEVFTEPFDPSKLEDPSLIIYAAVRQLDNKLIVTNGDQTDTIYDGVKGGKSFSDHSSNWECGGKCSGFSVSCSVVWKSCRAFFGREPCNLVPKELASDDRFLCVKHSPVFELFGFASMGWICAESVAALHTGLIGG